jgi:hypothetical protein
MHIMGRNREIVELTVRRLIRQIHLLFFLLFPELHFPVLPSTPHPGLSKLLRLFPVPHFTQNLPVLVLPHLHIHVSAAL